MPAERMIKRTVYVAKCANCGDEQIREDKCPRERQCKCGSWVPYVERSTVARDYGLYK